MARNASFLLSCRFVVTVMCFWSVTNMMYLRLNMSVAIVCMVNHSQLRLNTWHDSSNNITANNSCGSLFDVDEIEHVTIINLNGDLSPPDQEGRGRAPSSPCASSGYNKTDGEGENKDGPLNWDTFIQAQVLGAYYYGYAASKIPTGWAVRRVGGKKLILASSLVASITCLLTPIVALHSATAIILMRVLMGLCGGMICPAVQGVLSNWSPPSERSRMGAYTFAGFPCGTLAAFILAGFLCEFGFSGGWPSVFYTFGMFSLAFCLLWLVAVSETPESHLCIRRLEKNYIQASLEGMTTSDNKPRLVPWKRILTSPPVYAVIVSGISTDFIGNVFLLYLPTYLAEVMKFNISSSGLLSALPYVFCFLTLTLGGHLSDFLIKQAKLRTGTVRKLTGGTGMLTCVVSLICISFTDNATVAVTLLVLSVSGIGLMTISYFINPLDIAPEYSSVIVGIAGTAGDICGFISPTIVGAITAQGSMKESWQIVFLMSAGVVAVSLIFYVIFASGDIQPWARPPLEVRISQNLDHKEITTSSKQFKVTEAADDPSERLLQGKTLV